MTKTEFKKRRTQLLKSLNPNSIAILTTATEKFRNRDANYFFRPDSDFYYLTGFKEPEAIALFLPQKNGGKFILFCREKDLLLETWNGRRAGVEGAKSEYQANEAYPISQIDEVLPELLENKTDIYYTLGVNEAFDQRVLSGLNKTKEKTRMGIVAPDRFISLDPIIHEMRLRKSSAEIACMRKAAQISAKAHIKAMQACRPGIKEYAVEAELIHGFKQAGCQSAYNTIVGGGANGCILHYVENNETLNDGELLLIDAGAEYAYYAADITRTLPINGKFTPEQKAIYTLVLKAQLAAIRCVKPGNRWNQPHDAAVRVLTKGLVELGLLKGDVKQLIKNEKYRLFYMHKTGHWLGMDVHDVGEYKVNGKWRRLEPGMVLTVEPGLYIPQNTKGIAKKWRNIGVRIEDDVLVTKEGHEVLSSDVPKTIAEIESLMAKALQ